MSGDTPTILLAGPEQQSAGELRLLSQLAGAWPGRTQPEVKRLLYPQFLVRVNEPEPIRCPLDEVAVVLVTAKCDVHEIDRCLDGARDLGLATIVLAEDHERWKSYESCGTIVLPIQTSGAVLGPMLYALASRQSFVSRLMREVAIMQRCNAGVRAEVERIHEELHLAAGVQHEFTASPLPALDGLALHVLYRPVNTVSGDIYSVRLLDDDTLAFFVADAVGHGVPAALLTMILTNSLITADQMRLDGRGNPERLAPREVIDRLNRRLVEGSLHTGRFATGLYGLFNRRTGAVTVAGAGHPAPLVMGREGVRELSTTGPLLGVFPDGDFDQASTILKPGETLVLYTDGLEAAFPRVRAAGGPAPHLTHLHSVFGETTPTQPDEPLAKLEILLDEQSGSLHQADDITVLALTMLHPAASAGSAFPGTQSQAARDAAAQRKAA